MEPQGHPLPSDYEEQQKAAEQYAPDLSGPAISGLLSTSLISERYETGNDAYRDKSRNITAIYPHWRQVRGDGNCGWRALLFSYFELLLLEADLEKVDQEESRMKELTNTIASLGDDYMDLFAGEMDVILGLFEKFKDWLDDNSVTKAQSLHELAAFFDSPNAPHAIYMARLLTNAYMRTHKENFEMYMDVPLEQYCTHMIEAIDREIEELGIRALADLLLSPAGYGLEVVNLHDNPGSQVDVIPYVEPAKSTFRGAFSLADPPIARLFFYPTHYDIIYRERDVSGAPAEVE